MHINMHVNISQPTPMRNNTHNHFSVLSQVKTYLAVFSTASKLCTVSTFSHEFEQFH